MMHSFVCPYDLAPLLFSNLEHQCTACGRRFSVREGVVDFLDHQLGPASEQERKVRDEQIAPEGEDYGNPFRNRVEIPFILKHLSANDGDVVLDVGCGKGRVSLPLLKKVRVFLTGVDFSWPALTAFRRKVQTAPNIMLARADVAHMPVPCESYDHAICSMLLQHLPSDELVECAVSGMFRALKPGGNLIVTVLNYGRMTKRLGYPQIGYFPGTRVFIHHYTPDEILSVLSRRFKVECIVGLVHGLPKITTPIGRMGLPGIHINAMIDHGWRLLPSLRNYADVLGVVCHKQG